MGPQDPQDITKIIARDLPAAINELASLKAEATHWLTEPEYGALLYRLEGAHAMAEAALIEARRRVRMHEGREQ
jgi:hypothetical protein